MCNDDADGRQLCDLYAPESYGQLNGKYFVWAVESSAEPVTDVNLCNYVCAKCNALNRA